MGGMKLKAVVGVLLGGLVIGQGAERVYLACGNVGVRVAEFDSEKGTLTEPREAVSLQNAGFLAKHPSQPILFSTCALEGKKGMSGGVAAFSIQEDGQLELLNQSSTQGNGTCHLSIDESGKVILAANYSSGSVASFQVKEDGSLSEAVSTFKHEGKSVHPRRQKAPHAHYFTAGPKNQFAYVPDLGIDQVKIYRLDAETAELTPAGAGQLEGGAGPRHMKFSADGQFAYVLNELSLSVTTFAIGQEDGSMTAVDTVSVLPEDGDGEKVTCAEIRVHPNGRFVYTSQRDLRTKPSDYEGGIGRNSLSVFQVTEEGTLERIQTISAGVRIPRNFNFDPSEKWILVGGRSSNDIQVFSVDGASGKLAPHGDLIECPGAICFQFVE